MSGTSASEGSLCNAQLPEPIQTLRSSLGTDGAVIVINSYLDWVAEILERNLADAAALRDVAHALRPSSEMLGLGELAACCREIALRLKEGALPDVAGEAARVRALMTDGMPLLQGYVAALRQLAS